MGVICPVDDDDNTIHAVTKPLLLLLLLVSGTYASLKTHLRPVSPVITLRLTRSLLLGGGCGGGGATKGLLVQVCRGGRAGVCRLPFIDTRQCKSRNGVNCIARPTNCGIRVGGHLSTSHLLGQDTHQFYPLLINTTNAVMRIVYYLSLVISRDRDYYSELLV